MAQPFRWTTQQTNLRSHYGTVIAIDDPVNQFKRPQGTVISMENEEKQVNSQHGTVISTVP